MSDRVEAETGRSGRTPAQNGDYDRSWVRHFTREGGGKGVLLRPVEFDFALQNMRASADYFTRGYGGASCMQIRHATERVDWMSLI